MMMETRSVSALLALTYFTNYNIKKIFEWIAKYQDLVDVFHEESIGLSNPEFSGKIACGKMLAKASEIQGMLRYYGISTIPFYDKEYPKGFLDIEDMPPLLFLRGALLEKEMVAVVGTRTASPTGIEVTKKICELLAKNDHGIVSGLARGIDAAAHSAAIMKDAYQIAVLPNSLDQIYPKEHYGLASRILEYENGALFSELSIEINRGKQSFIQRNRLQVALAKAVIPVEMSASSGTMHTVRFCRAQKKKLLLLDPGEKWRGYQGYEGIFKLIDEHRRSPMENVFVFSKVEDLVEEAIKKAPTIHIPRK